jgi:hypothetical protein
MLNPLTDALHVPAAYLAVADEAYGRQIPFAFLERVADAFVEKFGEKGRTAAEGSLNASFRCAAVTLGTKQTESAWRASGVGLMVYKQLICQELGVCCGVVRG